MTTLTFDFNSF